VTRRASICRIPNCSASFGEDGSGSLIDDGKLRLRVIRADEQGDLRVRPKSAA